VIDASRCAKGPAHLSIVAKSGVRTRSVAIGTRQLTAVVQLTRLKGRWVLGP